MGDRSAGGVKKMIVIMIADDDDGEEKMMIMILRRRRRCRQDDLDLEKREADEKRGEKRETERDKTRENTGALYLARPLTLSQKEADDIRVPLFLLCVF